MDAQCRQRHGVRICGARWRPRPGHPALCNGSRDRFDRSAGSGLRSSEPCRNRPADHPPAGAALRRGPPHRHTRHRRRGACLCVVPTDRRGSRPRRSGIGNCRDKVATASRRLFSGRLPIGRPQLARVSLRSIQRRHRRHRPGGPSRNISGHRWPARRRRRPLHRRPRRLRPPRRRNRCRRRIPVRNLAPRPWVSPAPPPSTRKRQRRRRRRCSAMSSAPTGTESRRGPARRVTRRACCWPRPLRDDAGRRGSARNGPDVSGGAISRAIQRQMTSTTSSVAPRSARLRAEMSCHFDRQVRQHVAVACCATNTGWPR